MTSDARGGDEHDGHQPGVDGEEDVAVTVVGLRGTKDLKDLYSDVADPKGNILRGTQRSSDQYKADLKHFDSVKSKYGGDVSVTGHSLGASRAENVSRHRNVRGQAFNLGRGFGVQQVVEKITMRRSL